MRNCSERAPATRASARRLARGPSDPRLGPL